MDEENKFDPHPERNVEHFVWCALENVMCQFCLRGNLEPSSLLVEDFTQEYIQEGAFKGIPCFVLGANYSGQKGHALSLRNPTHDVENTKKKTYPCPYNKDELSCYQTLLKLFEMMPDADVCEDGRNGGRRLFRKPASKQELAYYKSIGHPEWKLTSKKSRVIGRNAINPILKKIAVWSGYKNPEKCTAHGKRKAGISVVANKQVGPATLASLGGHTNLKTVSRYHEPDQQDVDCVIRAKAGSPTAIRKELAEADPFSLTDEEVGNLMEFDLKHPPIYQGNDSMEYQEDRKLSPFTDRTNIRKPRRVSDDFSPRKHHRRSSGRHSPGRFSPERRHSTTRDYAPDKHRRVSYDPESFSGRISSAREAVHYDE